MTPMKVLFRSPAILGAVSICVAVTFIHSASAASQSENYVLDSAVVGGLGTNYAATSSTYQTSGGGYSILYYNGPTSTSGGGGGGEGGGGGGNPDEHSGITYGSLRHTVLQPNNPDFVYSEGGPLVLTQFLSGLLIKQFDTPQEFLTLYVPKFTNAQANDAIERTAAYSLSRIDYQQNPASDQNRDTNDLIAPVGNTAYTLSVTSGNRSIQFLRKLITLVLESPKLTGATDTSTAIYVFHPTHKAWVRVSDVVFQNNAAVFMTPYASMFAVVELGTPAQIETPQRPTKQVTLAPDVIRTPQTPATTTDTEIKTSVQNDRAHAAQTEIEEPSSPSPAEAPIVTSHSLIEGMTDFAINVIGEYFIPIAAGFAGIFILSMLYLLWHIRRGS